MDEVDGTSAIMSGSACSAFMACVRHVVFFPEIMRFVEVVHGSDGDVGSWNVCDVD